MSTCSSGAVEAEVYCVMWLGWSNEHVFLGAVEAEVYCVRRISEVIGTCSLGGFRCGRGWGLLRHWRHIASFRRTVKEAINTLGMNGLIVITGRREEYCECAALVGEYAGEREDREHMNINAELRSSFQYRKVNSWIPPMINSAVPFLSTTVIV